MRIEGCGATPGSDGLPRIRSDESNLLDTIKFEGKEILFIFEKDNSFRGSFAEKSLVFRAVMGFFFPLFQIGVLVFPSFVDLHNYKNLS